MGNNTSATDHPHRDPSPAHPSVVSALPVAGGPEPVLALAVVAVAVLALRAAVAELLAWKRKERRKKKQHQLFARI